MRLLYLTDTHIRGTTPRARSDDFPSILLHKLQEVKSLAAEHHVTALLHGGDLFDRPLLSPAVVGDFAACLQSLGLPIYAIAGNHDVYGHNPATLPRTMLGLLHTLGIVHVLAPTETILLREAKLCVQVTGRSFHSELDRRPAVEDYDIPRREEGVTHCVHMVHGMLCERSLPPGVPYTRVEDALAVTRADVLLTGHDHSGFPLRCREGKYAVNPGAFVRLYGQQSEWERQPQVALLTFREPGVTVDLLPLTSAPLGKTVLDRQALAESAYRREQLASFAQQVREAATLESMDAGMILAELAALHKLDAAVRDKALAYLQDAYHDEDEQ